MLKILLSFTKWIDGSFCMICMQGNYDVVILYCFINGFYIWKKKKDRFVFDEHDTDKRAATHFTRSFLLYLVRGRGWINIKVWNNRTTRKKSFVIYFLWIKVIFLYLNGFPNQCAFMKKEKKLKYRKYLSFEMGSNPTHNVNFQKHKLHFLLCFSLAFVKKKTA